MPEFVRERPGFRLTVQRPKVPSVVRQPFVLAGLAVLSSCFGSVVTAIALVVAIQAWRTRPARETASRTTLAPAQP
jgi:hypothetical protein